MGVFANLRPVRAWPALLDSSPVKREVVEGTDLVVVRELTGGLYFGKPRGRIVGARSTRVVDTLAYSSNEIIRILHVGFRLARTPAEAAHLGRQSQRADQFGALARAGDRRGQAVPGCDPGARAGRFHGHAADPHTQRAST